VKAPHIRVHFSFFAFNALIFLLHDGMLIMNFYTVCAIHEAGHIFAAAVSGKRIISADISGFGIHMQIQRSRLSTVSEELFILLSGPAANLLLYLLMNALGCGGSFPVLNLAAAVYNLLPYRQLDGGSVIALFTAGTSAETAALKLLTAVKLALSGALLALMLFCGTAVLPLFIASVILFITDTKTR